MMMMDNSKMKKDDNDENLPLPGFRFYPTDEELVGFYLKRKVEKRSVSLELIKQIEIYKYDPWDLPKANSTEGDNNEWYFYCKRGRKYRNSVRPNRVTGSGFWKATGIDKPIYSGDRDDHQLGRHDCSIIGLKKSLVYYRGNAGKGTKTDWMMHEFRLPDLPNAKSNALEAEVWTLCRIFKRSVSYRKYTSNWREISTCKKTPLPSMDTTTATSSKTCSMESANQEGGYMSFSSPDDLTTMIMDVPQTDKNFSVMDGHDSTSEKQLNQLVGPQLLSSSIIPSEPPFMASPSSFSNLDGKNEFYTHDDNWDELSSVLRFSHRSS